MEHSPSEDHIAFGAVTPWERSTFGRLPQRGDSAPCVPTTEKIRPSRSNSTKPTVPARRSVPRQSDGSRHRNTPPPEDSSRHRQLQESLSAQSSPLPYETPFFHAQAVPSPSPPPCYTKALPATPPDSVDEKSLASTNKSLSPYSKQVVNVLPGTMSARNGRSKSSARQRAERRKKSSNKPTSWKTVLRQLFSRDPVDETQFEKIEDRHWTDE